MVGCSEKKINRRADMISTLQELHWLQVGFRDEFKILCTICKLIRHEESSPQYQRELIPFHSPNIRAKSCDAVKLDYPTFCSKPNRPYGDHAFLIYAALSVVELYTGFSYKHL